MLNKIRKILDRIEFWILVLCLKRHANRHLDQFDNWEISSKYGKVFIDISRNKTNNKYTKID